MGHGARPSVQFADDLQDVRACVSVTCFVPGRNRAPFSLSTPWEHDLNTTSHSYSSLALFFRAGAAGGLGGLVDKSGHLCQPADQPMTLATSMLKKDG